MKLKKVLSASFAALLVTSGLVSCGEPKIEITGVSISNKATVGTDLYLQDTRVLEFSLSSLKDVKDYAITFKEAIEADYVKLYSSDETKVSVDKEGNIKALATGEATVTIESSKNKEIADSIKFTVFDRSITIDSVSISNEDSFAPNLALNATKKLDLAIVAHTGRNDSATVTAEDAITNKLISVKADDESILEVTGLNVKAKAVGTTKIKVLDKTNKTLKEINVSVVDRIDGTVSLNLIGEVADSYKVRQGDVLQVPTAVAYDEKGNDVSDDVLVTSSKGETFSNDGIFSSDVVGTHVLTYKISGKDGTTSAEKTISINVYQRIFADGGSGKITVESEDNNPIVKSEDTGVGIKAFYLPSGKSKHYYAEFNVSKVTNVDGHMMICAANFTNDETTPTTDYPMTYFGYKPSTTGYELASSKSVTSWDVLWGPRMWSSTDMLKGIASADPLNNDTKLGVARDGNYIYYFLNGALAYVDANPDLFGLDSMPGILLLGNDKVAPNVTISNFTILDGEEAKTKLNLVKPESQFRLYSPYGSTLDKQPATFQKNGFTYLDKVADEGIGFNDSMVTTNELYTNTDSTKWTVSFDMQATKFGDGGNWGKISFDLRTFHDKKTVTKFSLEQYLGNYTGAKFELSEIGASNVDVLSEINAALTGVVAVDKLHLEFSCYTSDFNEEKLSVKISTIDENPQTWSKDITLAYNNESQSMVSSPKYFVWHAEKWSGVISNYSLTFENLF